MQGVLCPSALVLWVFHASPRIQCAAQEPQCSRTSVVGDALASCQGGVQAREGLGPRLRVPSGCTSRISRQIAAEFVRRLAPPRSPIHRSSLLITRSSTVHVSLLRAQLFTLEASPPAERSPCAPGRSWTSPAGRRLRIVGLIIGRRVLALHPSASIGHSWLASGQYSSCCRCTSILALHTVPRLRTVCQRLIHPANPPARTSVDVWVCLPLTHRPHGLAPTHHSR